MINLFAIPASDQSILFLGRIFGPVGNVYPVTDAPLVFGVMFKVFNTIMLTVGTIVLIYTIVVGLLHTAHEGKFMGEKWSGLWVPLRQLIGIAALFPTPGGYSALQIVMMWVIVQGVGAADTLWNATLKYMEVQGSVTQAVTVPQPNGQMKDLLKSLVCQQTAGISDDIQVDNKPLYYCSGGGACSVGEKGTRNPDGSVTLDFGPTDAPGACGSISFCDSNVKCSGDMTDANNKIACAACKAQADALMIILSTFKTGVGQAFADIDHDYVQFIHSSLKPGYKRPEWITQYCASHNPAIDKNKCCYDPNADKTPNERLSLDLPAISQCASPRNFPDDFAKIAGGRTDYTNANSDAINQVYLPQSAQGTTNALANLVKGIDPISAASKVYVQKIVGAVSQEITNLPSKTSDMGDWRQDARTKGWIMAGSYYFIMSESAGNMLSSAKPFIKTTPFSTSGAGISVDTLSKYRNNYNATDSIIATIESRTSTQQSDVNLPLGLSAVTREMGSWAEQITARFMHQLTGGNEGASSGGTGGSFVQWATSPLSNIATLGRTFMILAQVFFTVFLVASVIGAWLSGIKVWVIGSGVDPGTGNGFMVFLLVVLPGILAFLVALFTFGAMLAIYVPLIPYILFVMSALGWLISCIEAMVAGPLVAIGILSPSGQHELLGSSDQGLKLLFSVFMRPSLMIFGLIAAALLSVVVVTMINVSFAAVMGQIQKNPGLLEIFVFLAAYVFFILSALNKCFALIHVIPERVMTWIGIQVPSYGEAEALGEVKGGVEKASAAAGGAIAAVGGQFGQATKMAQDRGKEAKKEGVGLSAGQSTPRQEGGGGGT